jgi:hypothetical protein
MRKFHKNNSKIVIIGSLMLIIGVTGPKLAYLATISTAPSNTQSNQVNTQKDVLNNVQGVLNQAEQLSEQGKNLSEGTLPTDLPNIDKGGFISGVWEGVKSFFADGGWKADAIAIGKTILRIIANVFIMIANVINKILDIL